MKGVLPFAAGLMVGVAGHVAPAQGQSVVMMNPVGINVPNISEAFR
jgi:hypothetical protein